MKWVDHITGETEDIRITQLGDKLLGVLPSLRFSVPSADSPGSTATPAFRAGAMKKPLENLKPHGSANKNKRDKEENLIEVFDSIERCLGLWKFRLGQCHDHSP